MITKELFGTCSAGTVDAYTLKNANGTYATILTMGGIIQKFVKDGIDICLGNDTLEECMAGSAYFGALIGRVGIRIADAQFAMGS
jgi:aldose 1-epimerase